MPCCLLIAVRDLEQRRFAPWTSENLNAGWQAATGETHWHGDGGKTRWRRKARAIVTVGRVEITDQPRWKIPRGINNHVQSCAVHGLEHSLSKAALDFSHFLALWILVGHRSDAACEASRAFSTEG